MTMRYTNQRLLYLLTFDPSVTDLWILCSGWSLCSSAAHLNLCRPNIGMDEGEPPAAKRC